MSIIFQCLFLLPVDNLGWYLCLDYDSFLDKDLLVYNHWLVQYSMEFYLFLLAVVMAEVGV